MEVAAWLRIGGSVLLAVAGILYLYRAARQKRPNDSEAGQPWRAVRQRLSKGTR